MNVAYGVGGCGCVMWEEYVCGLWGGWVGVAYRMGGCECGWMY